MTVATKARPAAKAAAKKAAPKRTTAAPTVKPEPWFTIKTRTLLRNLTEASVFAGTDVSLPMLRAVRLSLVGGKLSAAATDRYMIGIVTEQGVQGDDFEEFLLSTDHLPRLRKILTPDSRRDDPLLRVTVTAEALKIEQPNPESALPPLVVAFRPVQAKFPPYKTLFPATEAESGPGSIGLNASFVARFNRVARGRGTPMRFSLGATPSKPVTVVIGDHFVGMIMPVRLGATTDTLTAALERVA